MKRKQAGFTLVELAIVLVIIGLLLAGILKGQELINNTKVKALATDFRNIPSAYYGYMDKFRAVPGDDAGVHVAGHLPTATLATTPAGTVGNGRINGLWRPANPTTDESSLAWQHLRLSNFLSGSTTPAADATYLPVNALGGLMGMTGDNPVTLAGGGADTTFAGSFYICSDAIDGAMARQLDAAMDDGVGTTGSMRAIAVGTTSGVAVAYVDGTSYVVCMAH